MQDTKLDHREIAKNLKLYISNETIGQGLPIFLPNYVIIRNQLQNFLRKKQVKFGFKEVVTPFLGNEKLYKTSGHLQHYFDYMFPKISKNNEHFYLRPMTCPHHCLIYLQKPRSYKKLPFRLCENSILHRYETSGSLKGLERSRWMELADHHIFTSLKDLKEEFKNNYYYINDILSAFNFKISRLICALHDPKNSEKYHPDQEKWEKSENLLINSLDELNIKYTVLKGEAAFYGPKLDFEIVTADGKSITLATIQIDFVLPLSFDLKYIDQEQKNQTPVIIHQSPIGTYQRFIALLLEKTSGKLPLWLSPIQLVILPLNNQENVLEYIHDLKVNLDEKEIRSEIWSGKTLSYSIKEIHKKKVPYYLVIGEDEVGNKKLEKEKNLKLNNVFLKKTLLLNRKELVNKIQEEIKN